MTNLVHSLCIQLLIVNRACRINRTRHLNAHKTTATGRISQQILLIAGRDKRSITPQLLHRITVRFTKIDYRLLQNMLQKALLRQSNLIELVNIDQRKAIQIHFRIPLPAEINTIRIISAKSRRYQIPAKGRLACPLRTYQQRGSTVRMLPVIPTPMSYHVEEPAMEKHRPMRISTWHTVCQFRNAVFFIPIRKMKNKFFQWIINRYSV